MERALTVRIRQSVYAIPLEEIIYLENELRKIRVKTIRREYLYYGTFREALEELDEAFLKVSRSFILNQKYIRAMRHNGHYEIIMADGRRIPLAKNSFLAAKHSFEQYLRQRQDI